MSPDAETRFWAKVIRGDGCWEWTAYRNASGYGVVARPGGGGRTMLAHRFAWEMQHGPAGDLCVCHHCDNRGCVRVEHMFLGTNADNVEDRRLKRRGADVRGERNPKARLWSEDVRSIRALFALGVLAGEMMPIFGVARSTVHRAARGSWRCIP